MSEFPKVTHVLVKELEQRFPDRMPPKDTAEADIRYKQGQVSVVRFLREMYNQQNEKGI